MAAARKTTNTTRSTSTAKADDTAAKEAAAKEAAAAKAADDAKADEPTNSTQVEADKVETETVKNPVLDGGQDVKPDETEDAKEADEQAKAREEKHEESRKALRDGVATSEAYDDPQVNLADLPVHHDPVVTADHQQASAAAEVDNQKIVNAAPVQLSQMDNSVFGNDVRDTLSFKNKVEVKDDDKK